MIILPDKVFFLENWLILLSTFSAQLCYNVKKIVTLEQIMRYKASQFWTKLIPNGPFSLKKIFRKFDWHYFCLRHVPHHSTTMFQSRSRNIMMHNFWTNWPRQFWQKLIIVTFVYLLCHIILKLENKYIK